MAGGNARSSASFAQPSVTAVSLDPHLPASGESVDVLSDVLRAVRLSGALFGSVYRFDGDRIIEGWYAYDVFGLLQQLGALPATATTNA